MFDPNSDITLHVHYRLKETIVTIGADSEDIIEIARASIRYQRSLLEDFIRSDPFFQITFEPYEVLSSAPEIIRRMAHAGQVAGIGPMSAVAGTIAVLAVEAMIDAGAVYAFVDNGGDIALVTDRPVIVGVYTACSSIQDLALDVAPCQDIIGICTSSGTVGPSISLGNADAAVVVSGDVPLADAMGTALGNEVNDVDGIESCFDMIRGIKGIDGALIVKKDRFAVWGDLPKIVRSRMKTDIITKA
ncbi:MAG: UPF0280 family protein [Methanosarcinales archaeon]|nr:UPF0280 family protein [Methanosarcinales archaeon]